MFKCGIAYPRCKWILPLLLLCAIIFDIIALAGRGWVETESGREYASLWETCKTNANTCSSLMDYAWGRATAALMIIGIIILIFCFILSFVGLCVPRINLLRVIGALLFLAVALQICALVIYPVRYTSDVALSAESYLYSWTYGFGWGSTIIMFGCGVFFCCLPNFEDELLGNVKTKYFYTSS
ncbi:p53 apoptosis effector related to PMP-22 [Dendropsophus ebraccatus]|uniref:p53 apoptosis effector related to PMP-22 n=1 Tax=Dendropsophus ebraccatus TaxID=150705 RepID=UPI0038313859